MKLELYKMDTCPYCQRVMHAIKASGRTDVVLKDIRKDRRNQEYLIEHGGKDLVPCLFIDGKPLYESLDIIKWLADHPQEECASGLKAAASGIIGGKKKSEEKESVW